MAFKVKDEYRENPLSTRPGGVSVFVKYENGQVREYDKVKNPWLFKKAILEENSNLEVWYNKK